MNAALITLIEVLVAPDALAVGGAAGDGAPASGEELFGLQRTVFTVVVLGVVLVLLALLFMTRRFLGWLMNAVFLFLGVVLVIVALFGHQLGVYEVLEEISRSPPRTDQGPPLP